MKSRVEQHRPYIETQLAAGTPVAHIAAAIGIPERTVRDWVKANSLAPAPPEPVVLQQPSREEMLEAELAEYKTAARKDRKAAVADERIIAAIERALETVRAPKILEDWGAEVYIPAVRDDAHHRQLLMLSDFHGGEVVDPAVLNGLNSYNWEIMRERVFEELIPSVLSHLRNSPPVTGLDVLFIGDMCSGENHEELAVTNEYPLAEQAVKMGYLQAEIIEALAPHVPSMRAGGVEGNHPRFGKAPAAKNPHNNGDWIANTIAAARVELIGVPFEVGRGSLLWEVAGRTCYVWHGDGIRSSMPGVPWGGVVRRTNEIQTSYRRGQHIDHFLFGHFHQPNWVQGGRVIGNGALKGTDEWVTKNFGGAAPPTQLLLEFDETAQRMTGVKPITPTAGL